MTKGVAAFVIPKKDFQIFAIVDPEKYIMQNKNKPKVFQYFGMEDAILNHT
jgi:hypothetical protein